VRRLCWNKFCLFSAKELDDAIRVLNYRIFTLSEAAACDAADATKLKDWAQDLKELRQIAYTIALSRPHPILKGDMPSKRRSFKDGARQDPSKRRKGDLPMDIF
jgi:hypothetical protein